MAPKSRSTAPSPTDIYGRTTPTQRRADAARAMQTALDERLVSLNPDPETGDIVIQAQYEVDGQKGNFPTVVTIDNNGNLVLERTDKYIESLLNRFSNPYALKATLNSLGYYSSESAYLESLSRPTAFDQDTMSAVAKAVTDMSTENFRRIKFSDLNAGVSLFSFEDYLTSATPVPSDKSGRAAPITAYQTSLTAKQSRDLLANTMLNLIGRDPTKNEIADFKKRLDEVLKAKPTRVNVQGQTRIEQQGINPEQFASEYVLSRVVNPAYRDNPDIEFGGQIGELRKQLKDYANSMGISIGTAALNNRVLKVANQKTTAQDQITRLRNLAIEQYKPFAQRLQEDEDLTVRELANPYIQLMADTLEMDADSISLTDKNIQDALLGEDGMTPTNLRDFRRKLRKDPRFDYTMQAGQEAAAVAKGLLKAFGYGV